MMYAPPGMFHEPMNGAIFLRASSTRFLSAVSTTVAVVTFGFLYNTRPHSSEVHTSRSCVSPSGVAQAMGSEHCEQYLKDFGTDLALSVSAATDITDCLQGRRT